MEKKQQAKASTPKKKQSSEERHARDCKVCKHKDREAIEREWTS